MSEHLLLFTIGPVQEFIVAARRTRDLWAGSYLLSELARVAAKTLRDTYRAAFMFPALDPTDANLKKHDVVNRLLVRVTAENPMHVCQEVEKSARQHLVTLCKQTFDDKTRVRWPDDPVKNHRSRAELQVADLLEIYWATTECTDNYQQDRADIEAALAARKTTRDFVQPTWADFVPKSSIDGLRESVIDEDEYPRGLNDPEREQKTKRLFEGYGAKGAERLSGVDLLKRHYRPQHIYADFPSTSHFAALPVLMRYHTTRKQGLATYINSLRHLYDALPGSRRLESMRLDKRFETLDVLDNYDASILFGSRLEEDLERESIRAALHALDTYRKQGLGGQAPEPYYALLHADGDFMGRAIDELAKYHNGRDLHHTFSHHLSLFASNVREIVEQQHMGALVYSGGDDVLAFLPLNTVLRCAKILAQSFATQMRDFGIDPKPSLSVGIAICHHLEPLSDTLDLARSAEKIAKQVPGKNALAITLSKRGSGERTISGSWAERADDHNQGFYDRLQKLTTWHRQGVIPDSAAFDLHNLIERLGNTLPLPALKAEAVRIVKRKRGQRGQAEQAHAALVALAETLPADAEAAQEWGVAQFANELIVTREFAKALGPITASQQTEGVAV